LNETTTRGIAFIDFTNSKAQPKEILKILRKQIFVKNAEIIEPSKSLKGMIYDAFFFPLEIKNERVIIIRESIYKAFFEGIRREFGSAGEAMLYYQGFNVGCDAYNSYIQIAGSRDLEKLIEVAWAVNATLGWGIIKVDEINEKKGTAIVKIYQNFECAIGKKYGKPYSQFYRGAIAGIFTKHFGRKTKVTETKCIAKEDPYCEFHVKTSH